MQRLLIICGLFGCLPIVGWAASVVLSFVYSGSPFEWGPFAYAPLFIITGPLKSLYLEMMVEEHPSHFTVLLYAVVSASIYFAIAVFAVSPLLAKYWVNRSAANPDQEKDY